jgi:hypothetical protein
LLFPQVIRDATRAIRHIGCSMKKPLREFVTF